MSKKPYSNPEIVTNHKLPSVVPSAMSVYDIAMALEQAKVDPITLEKDVLFECALIYRSRRYPISQIASILKVDSRTVSRYIAEARKMNSIKASPHFQAEFIGDSLNNLWAQYARLIRWSYSDELSEADKIRATLSACQIQKYAIELMERLGYLNPTHTQFNMKSEIAAKYGEDSSQEWATNLDLLNDDQLYTASVAKLEKEKELNSYMEKVVSGLYVISPF